MKRGTPDHPKARQLAQVLRLARYEVVGVLESLWHFTAAYAKRGDIGRWSDSEIAAAMEWKAEPGALIDALVECRFLDRDPTHRLLVHDWQDHADQTVFRSEEVKKHGFAGHSPAEPSEKLANASNQLANASQPKPKPKPCQSLALPKPDVAGDASIAAPAHEPVSPPPLVLALEKPEGKAAELRLVHYLGIAKTDTTYNSEIESLRNFIVWADGESPGTLGKAVEIARAIHLSRTARSKIAVFFVRVHEQLGYVSDTATKKLMREGVSA